MEEKILDLHYEYMKKEADLIIEENELYENKNNSGLSLTDYIESLESILNEKKEMLNHLQKKIN